MNRQPDPAEQALIEEVRAVLDDGVQSYDAQTRHRLRAAREAALEQAVWRSPAWWWAGAAGLAASLALLAVLLLPSWQDAEHASDMATPELLAMAGESDLYQDLEFYRWLAAREP